LRILAKRRRSSVFTLVLTQSGLHHLSVCDVNGVAGALRISVQQK
jgi:hypothetical protein